MSSVTSCPAEIILSIANGLPQKEVFALRKVCATFSGILASESLRRIVIDLPLHGSEGGLSALKTLALEAEKHPVRGWAQALVIKNFNVDPMYEGSEVLVWVRTVIRNLTQITSLEWLQGSERIWMGDEHAVLLVGALQPLMPSLQEVRIHTFCEAHYPLLDGLSRLSHLLLRATRYVSSLDMKAYARIHGAISRSANTLESLMLGIAPGKGSSSEIHELIQASNSKPFPELRSLSLEIQGDLEMTCRHTSLTSHFSSLRALHLNGGRVYRHTLPPEQHNIFTVLMRSCIYLEDVVSYISAPLLLYLTSYSNTLEKLAVRDFSSGSSSRAVSQGFNSILLQHKDSLRELTMRASFDDGLAFGDNNNNLLTVPLPALTTLNIPVFLTIDGGKDRDHLRTCLDRALNACNFPFLRQVTINVTVNSASMRNVRTCSQYYPSLRKRCCAIALQQLPSYRFTATQGETEGKGAWDQKLPSLSIQGIQDIFLSLEEDGWQYKACEKKNESLKSEW
ncbi:hypothetical protein BKA70DRAFT_1560926 [Coprinopsis sp. MPI-PUGE-AT-0042]|nr:hypothetical protein BKA70DRAFT_1560926 [Coprinopsis sp. MPI-PUGE-AT-0042]